MAYISGGDIKRKRGFGLSTISDFVAYLWGLFYMFFHLLFSPTASVEDVEYRKRGGNSGGGGGGGGGGRGPGGGGGGAGGMPPSHWLAL
mmetsp:Transcript_41486/g.69145  ORF Transcript_41486/g.69145 Transcript_41486/m.69145 type:complete len:89 (-) Transcript_41486:1118-1384(-)